MKFLQIDFWRREYFSLAYKIAFLNAISLRVQVGESVGQALLSVINSELNLNKKRDMQPATKALEQGLGVASAFSALQFFDATIIAILQAGERSDMQAAIKAAVNHLEVKQAWFNQHSIVLFILFNELLSALCAPVVLYSEILPWIKDHITPPNSAEALLNYQSDMQTAEVLTLALITFTFIVVLIGCFNIYRISQFKSSPRLLKFFSDSAMGVGFGLAASMLKAGVTIERVAYSLGQQAPGWARSFWREISRDLERATEPALALQQTGLYGEERSLLLNHQNAVQLAEIFLVLAKDRERRAKRGKDLLLMGGTIVTVMFMFLCLGVAVWIYAAYDNTLSAGLEALGNGF